MNIAKKSVIYESTKPLSYRIYFISSATIHEKNILRENGQKEEKIMKKKYLERKIF